MIPVSTIMIAATAIIILEIAIMIPAIVMFVTFCDHDHDYGEHYNERL